MRSQHNRRRSERRGECAPARLSGAVGNDTARRRRLYTTGSRDGNHGANGHSASNEHTASNRHPAVNRDAATDGDPTIDRDAPGYGDTQYQRGDYLPRQHEL
jgi:hypothetical protein